MKYFQRHVTKGTQLGDSAKTLFEQSHEYIVYNEAAHSDRPLGGFHGQGYNERGDYNSSIITIPPTSLFSMDQIFCSIGSQQDDYDHDPDPGGVDGRGEDELELGVQGGEASLHSGELTFFILLNALLKSTC